MSLYVDSFYLDDTMKEQGLCPQTDEAIEKFAHDWPGMKKV